MRGHRAHQERTGQYVNFNLLLDFYVVSLFTDLAGLDNDIINSLLLLKCFMCFFYVTTMCTPNDQLGA